MSLTTQLLADAVTKGGPGSGPQGGRNASTEHANKLTVLARQASIKAKTSNTSSDHKAAADAHRLAATARNKESNDLADRHAGHQRILDSENQQASHADQARDHDADAKRLARQGK